MNRGRRPRHDGGMDPDRLALIEALERQLHFLRRIRERLQSTDRVRPGTSTFWSGLARSRYEDVVARLHEALESTDTALAEAVEQTSRALGTMRHG
jgi:hypothetical protein